MQRGSGLGKRVLILVVAACAVLAVAVTAGAIPPPDPGPGITGTAAFGQTLTGSDGVWSGDPPPTLTREWLRCDAAGGNCQTTGDNDNSYVLDKNEDVGATIRFQVSGDNGDGDPKTAVSPQTAQVTRPATSTAPPSITGTATVGASLTYNAGTWVGFPAPAVTNQWLRCDQSGGSCDPVGPANAGTYSLTAADAGSTIRVAETGTNSTGSPTVTSAQTAVVTGPPVVTTQPTLDNPNPVVGQAITANPGAASGPPPPTPSFAWQRCDTADGAGCVPVGSNSASYATVPDDRGKFIRVVVTWSNGIGAPVAATPAVTAQAVRMAPANTAPPALSNAAPVLPPALAGAAAPAPVTIAVNQPPGTWIGFPATFAYQYEWQLCPANDPATCVPIPDATAATYTVKQEDVGLFLRAKVTAGNNVPPPTGAPPSFAFTPLTQAVRQAPSNTGANGMQIPLLAMPGDVPARGQTITGSSGVWFAFPAPAITHQWQRCNAARSEASCVDVGAAVQVTPQTTPPFTHTGASPYPVTDADLGSSFRLKVTVTNGLAPPAVLFSIVSQPARGAPVNLAGSPPTLADGNDGEPKRGETLTATSGLWTGFWAAGAAPLAINHKWQRCPADGNPAGCADIAAPIATPLSSAGGSPVVTCTGPGGNGPPPGTGSCNSASVFLLTDADLGSRLRVVVTVQNGGGTVTVPTAMTPVVLGAPIIPGGGSPDPASLPKITGDAREGLTLVASTGSWSAFPKDNLAYSYEWLRCTGAALDSCSVVAGATRDTYFLGPPDVGKLIRVRVTARNGVAPDGVAASMPTAAVAAAPAGGTGGPGADMILQLGVGSSGSEVTYTLSVRNIGIATAEGVTVKATLGSALSLVSAKASTGSCAGSVNCSLGAVAPGGSATVEITARATSGGTIPFTATVSSTNADVNPSNNTVSSATQVTAASTRGPSATTAPTTPGTKTTPAGEQRTTAINKVAAKLRARKVGNAWVVKTRFSLVSGKAKLLLTVTPNGSLKRLAFMKGSRLGKSVARSTRRTMTANAPKPATFPLVVVMPARGFSKTAIYVIRIKATSPTGLSSQLDIGFKAAVATKPAAAKKRAATGR